MRRRPPTFELQSGQDGALARSVRRLGDLNLRRILMGRRAGERRGLRLPCLSGRSVGVAALDGNNGRDRVFENQLLLVIGLEHQRVLIEALDPSR